MCKVSIVMPSYNVSKYIRECLQSVINQTLQDIEIICIDAGSTDGTREIISEFADMDTRVRIIDSKKKSCGYQENIGITVAKGEYIGFVETDDYVREDMFEILYNTALKDSLDYVKANHICFVNVDENYRLFIKERTLAAAEVRYLYDGVFSPLHHPEIMCYDHCMWNGIYKTAFLKEKKVRLNETLGAAYQDYGFEMQVACLAERGRFLDMELYYYRKDNESSSMKNPNGLIDMYGEFQYVKEFMENNTGITDQHWWTYFQKLCGTSIRGRLCKLLLVYGNLPEEMDDILEKIRQEYIWGLSRGYILPVRLGYSKVAEIKLLIEDKKSYLNYLHTEIKLKYEVEQQIIKEAQKRNQVIIFGSGICGKRLYTLLSHNGVKNVVAFCDNNEEKSEEQLFGKDILPLAKCRILYPEAAYIIATSRYVIDMLKVLTEAKVDSDNILYYQITNMEI